jgi:hypothetical protein
MGRGGQREGAGRKSGWTHSETQTIRVPKIFVAQILDYARQLDSGVEILEPEVRVLRQIESETISEIDQSLEIAPGQISLFEPIDSATESKVTSLTGGDLNKRLKLETGQVSRMKGRFKNDPKRFVEWSQKRERKIGLPVVGWLPNVQTGLYDAVDSSCDDF